MAIALYDNFVIENKITDIVNSKLDVHPLMTIDNTLATDAGLKKYIHKYTYSGNVRSFAKGTKNTQKGSVAFGGRIHRQPLSANLRLQRHGCNG